MTSHSATDLISGGTMVLGGIALAILGVVSAVRGMRSRRWPTVKGHIVRVRRRPVQVSSMGVLPTKQTEFVPAVQYRYSVDDREYVGSRLRMGGSGLGNLSWAYSQTSRYSPDQEVIVYVSPSDPSVSVLEAGETGNAVATILIGLACVGIGLLSVLPYL